LLQRTGPKLGLILTEGFAATLYASDNDDEELEAAKAMADIILPSMRVEIKEEIDSSGEIRQPLDEEDVRQAVEYLLDSGARGIVISLQNSSLNPTHEQKAKAVIDSEYPRHYLGSVPVLTASAITAHSNNHIHTRYKPCSIQKVDGFLGKDRVDVGKGLRRTQAGRCYPGR
jgi:N-methylhydantoinase A/oxoprolinase/acetone carboxylase beta subunit